MGEPFETIWYAEGRIATRDEVIASIDSGYPLLQDACERERYEYRRREARAQLANMRDIAMELIPEA